MCLLTNIEITVKGGFYIFQIKKGWFILFYGNKPNSEILEKSLWAHSRKNTVIKLTFNHNYQRQKMIF